jgi:hypothetical protein
MPACVAELAWAPQPLHTLSPSATSVNISICKPPRFFLPKKQSATASTEPGNHGVGLPCKARAGFDVVIVRAVKATPPTGATVAGEKLHKAPEGNPVQLNVHGAENEFCVVTKTVTTPLCPAVTESVSGETATERLGVVVKLMV